VEIFSGTVTFTQFRNAADLGNAVVISTEGGYSFAVDTGMAHLTEIVTSSRLVILNSHACTSAAANEGVLSSICSLDANGDVEECTENCMIAKFAGNTPIQADLEDDFVIDEFYRTKNSLDLVLPMENNMLLAQGKSMSFCMRSIRSFE